ncbi:4-hydroxy-tetrahydrodipicolinate synthase [Camelliibacillus cellulosilyticus]|uniref:4-hydroxy-tetrahydrodipicolinate synthase n=1 Tax=Camelliibacillus cellulosilyticus TaxID=2174486 RepID=A0ABV9GJW7_9BACL
MAFGRLLTAMVTPFNENGEVDKEKTTILVNHLIDHGTEGLVVAGTTGESPTLTHDEKLALFAHVIEVSRGRVPIIAGTGSNNTAETVSLTKEAEALGADGVMIVAPYYSKPNQEGLYQHFKTVAEAVNVPVMVYNVPGRTAVNITPDTIVKLSRIDNIKCVKEASGNLDQMADIIEQTPDDFVLYSGDDGLTLPVLAIGGHGVVSVASHVIGDEMQQMIHAFNDRRLEAAASLHRRYLPLMRAIFSAPSPVPIKALLKWQGIDVGGVRLPMVPLSEAERIALENIYQQCK